jgi:hypothetical protein
MGRDRVIVLLWPELILQLRLPITALIALKNLFDFDYALIIIIFDNVQFFLGF